jgi:hypothetical protein
MIRHDRDVELILKKEKDLSAKLAKPLVWDNDVNQAPRAVRKSDVVP